ncbi:phosphatidylserine/phosphatidylglycerophosphate/cardiolipin synthase-like enzyme [Arcticibacter tournemirensis]|nr:phospholipase D-like domain-containing protein [Arcticibacter tournemirensis]TQM49814.1 phosphatidylserine/phosphatidylglycerophosphate/cardiolipin synthase-like enzyme [Arcticibacter tournemirensis]
MKRQLNYSLLIFLLLFAGCKKGNDKDDNGSGTATIALNLPDAIFTDLTKVSVGQASPVIMDRLIALIDATPANATIHLSIFGFDHSGVINALKKASERGVILHIMIDMSVEDTKAQNPPTISTIRGFIKAGSEVVVVTNDVNTSSINHNKFVLFSELNTDKGKVSNVVFQTSHNFTVDDSKKIQDAVTMSHEGLYNAYVTYWNDIKAKASSGMKDFYYKEYVNDADGITAFFFPKRRNGISYGDDTIIEILNNITEPSTATVRVGMSDWVVSRINVANKLSELVTAGAKVEVVVKNKIDDEVQAVLRDMQSRGAFVKIYDISRTNIHSKFLLIEGKYKGQQCTIVATGSHNYTTNALRNNNETLLMLKNSSLYAKYISYYNEMKKLPGIN